MTNVKCDIILPVCDQFQFTKNCIDSIVGNTDTPYRIIGINNGKNEDTKSYLSRMKDRLGDRLIVIQNETNIGWVRALNQGIEISSAPFLCFQNDDTVVTKGWLKKMIKILEEHKDIGLVNPSWEGRPKHISMEDYGRVVEKKYKGEYIETDWARGFSVVLKKEVVEKIGGIDEDYGLAYFDDVDFSVRAVNAGFLVVVALDTYVYHHRNATFFEVLKGKRWNELHERNKYLYYRKCGKPLKIAIILDKNSCNDDGALNEIKDTVYYLARRQHHIDIWSPYNVSRNFQHTNINFKSYSTFLLWIVGFFDLYSNTKKKEGKRYSAVFSFDKKFGNFILGKKLFDDMPIYVNMANGDFNKSIKNRVDAIKEKTREFYNGKV